MMTVDPTDDATFWYTNEYYATTSAFNWKTRIASLNLGAGVTPSGILVWDGVLGGQDYSGAYINNYLTNAGLTTTYTDVFPTSLIGYDAVFLSFGNYGAAGSNAFFDNTMAAAVEAYLNAGGKVYLEGGDALGYDQSANTTLLNLFGLLGTADGQQGPSPITALAGQPGTLTAGMLFNSSTQVENNWIDVYTAGAGSIIAFNEPTVGNVAAQYSGAGGSKTFCFSYALSELTDGTAPSTKDDLMAAIINFFGIGGATGTVVGSVNCADSLRMGDSFTADVRIDMSNMPPPNENLGSFIATLTWDPTMLSYTGDSGILSGFTGIVNVDAPNGTMTFNGANPLGAANIVFLLFVNFDVIGAVGSNTCLNLQFSAMAAAFTFIDLLPFLQPVQPRCLVITNPCTPGFWGDINDDGLANSTDALIILSFDAGIPLPQPILDRIMTGFGDVNLDAFTNSTDALIILSYDAGITVPFPVGQPICISMSAPAKSESNIQKAEKNISAFLTTNADIVKGKTIDVPVTVDMSRISEELGSYTVTLQWDPAQLQFQSYSGGTTKGFSNPVVNDAIVEKGKLIAAHAYPYGADGQVNILNLRFKVIGNLDAITNDEISMDFSAMAAAKTFTNLLPNLEVGDAEAVTATPATYSIDNYPNPFNPTTTIGFTLPEASQTRLQIYNIRGQLVRTLVSSNLEAGYHKVEWDGKNENGVKVASGVYIYQIHAGNFVQTKKMIMMK